MIISVSDSDDSCESSSEAPVDFDESSQCASSASSLPPPHVIKHGFIFCGHANYEGYYKKILGDDEDYVPHGIGVMKYYDGDVIEGLWKDGEPVPYKCSTTMTSSNRRTMGIQYRVYTGMLTDIDSESPSCDAVVEFDNGDVYRGECKADWNGHVLLFGKGVMTFANGEVANQEWDGDNITHYELVQPATSENTIKCGFCKQKKGHNRRTCPKSVKRKAMVEEDSVVVKKNPLAVEVVYHPLVEKHKYGFAVGEEVLVETISKFHYQYKDAVILGFLYNHYVIVQDNEGTKKIHVELLKNKDKYDAEQELLSIRNTRPSSIEREERQRKKRKVNQEPESSEEPKLLEESQSSEESHSYSSSEELLSQMKSKNPSYTLCPQKIKANQAFVDALEKLNGIGRIAFLETAALNTVKHLLKSGVGENSHLDLINYDAETAARIGVGMWKLKKKEGRNLGDYSIHMMSSSSFLRGETRSFQGLWLDYECTFSDKVENNDLQYVFKNGLFDAGGGILALTVCLRNDQGRSKQVHAVITKLAEDNGYTRKSLDMNGDGIQFTEEDAFTFKYRNMKLFLYEIRKKN